MSLFELRTQLPRGWTETTFKREFEFLKTGSNSREQLSEEGEVGYIHYGDLHKRPSLYLDLAGDTLPRIDQELVRGLPTVRAGDLVMVDASEDTACIGIASELYGASTRRVVAGLHTMLLRPLNMHPGFAALIPHQPDVRRQLVGIASGVSVFGITRTNLERVKFCLPPITIQREIVEVVREMSRLAELMDCLILKKTHRRNEIAESILTGRRRLPGFTEPWREMKLAHILVEANRYDDWSDDEVYRLLSIRRRSGGLFERGHLRGSEILTKVMKSVKANDFLISKMQVVHGAWGLVTGTFEGGHVSDSYICLVARRESEIEMAFLDQLSRLTLMRRLALRSSYGVHIEKMTFRLDLFLKEKILIPSYTEQQAIANVLGTMDEEIELLRKQRDLLDQQKRGLMQKLLTGEVRLKEFR